MTRNRSLKKAVRAQMLASGQTYMQAREHVCTVLPRINSDAIPLQADYPVDNDLPWNVFPMGLGENGAMITWDITQAAHAWLAGQTGAGKSMTQRNIVLHCLHHPDQWDFYGVDFKRVEMSAYKTLNRADVIKSVDYTLEDALTTLTRLSEEVDRRYELLQTENTTSQDEPQVEEKNILLMIDEVAWLVPSAHDPIDSEAEQEQLRVREVAKSHLEHLVRTGRAVGVHVVLSSQITGTALINNDMYANMSARYVFRSHRLNYLALLGEDMSAFLDAADAGRAIISINGQLKGVQTFYTSPEMMRQHQK